MKERPDPFVVSWSSAGSAAKHAGLSTHMVNYLCRHGIVVPSAGEERGRGKLRKYSFTDVLLLRVVAKLLSNGVSALRLRKSLVALRSRGEKGTQEILSKKYLVTDGFDIYFQDKGALEALETGQMSFAFVLELTGIRKDVAEKMGLRHKPQKK